MKNPNPKKSRSIYRILESNAAYYTLALGLACALKFYYSMASPEQLAWVIAPTAKVTETLFRIPFEFETGTGYICRERGIIIAPACAGVNFMIMCFLISIFPFIHRFGKQAARFAWFTVSVAVAYTVAVSVNAFRIFLSLHLHETDISLTLQDPGRLHRMGGIFVYLGALHILYSVLEKTADALGRLAFFEPPNCNRTAPQKGQRMLPVASPVFVYLSLTIIVPLLNKGASRIDPLFLEHCAAVVAVCLVVFSAALLLKYFLLRRIKKR